MSDGTGDRSWWWTVVALLGTLLAGFYLLPLAALFLGQPPGAVLASLRDPFVVAAARTTVLGAAVSTAAAALLGVPLGYALARWSFRGRTVLTAVVAFPLVLPPVVSGMLLLSVFGESGIGGLLGAPIGRTFAGVVLAQTFVASPFVVFSARSAFERVDRELEEVAWTLGVSEWATFRRVTLPLSRRGILAGVTLAFARAAGEFGATLMLAYHPRTLPVQIWVAFQGGGVDAAFPVAVVLVVVALAALVAINSLGGSRLLGGG
ncbi:MAG: ABC transporter permease [Haloarculaceae archaeon]